MNEKSEFEKEKFDFERSIDTVTEDLVSIMASLSDKCDILFESKKFSIDVTGKIEFDFDENSTRYVIKLNSDKKKMKL